MSRKKKILGSLIFMVCFLSFTVFIVGALPHWSIATQLVILPHNSSLLNEGSLLFRSKTILLEKTRASDSHEDSSTTVKKYGTVASPSSALPDQGAHPAKTPPDQSNPPTEEIISQPNGTLSQSEETQSVTSQQQLVQSKLEPTRINIATEKVDMSPTPPPGLPGTPIRSYYDEAGNPPTAPGLAMRQRKFQPENDKMAYLTFDDGPYPSTTPRILAILAEENIRATFFNIGLQVELYPDLLKAEYEHGHAIGNHTHSHNIAELYKDPKVFLADVRKAEELIYKTIGLRPQIVRAPGGTVGHFNIDFFNTMDAAGYLIEDWNVDPGDTHAVLVPANLIVEQVNQQIQGKTRVVILLHDIVGKDTTIEALPEIIQLLKKQGFSFGVLGPDVLPILFADGLRY